MTLEELMKGREPLEFAVPMEKGVWVGGVAVQLLAVLTRTAVVSPPNDERRLVARDLVQVDPELVVWKEMRGPMARRTQSRKSGWANSHGTVPEPPPKVRGVGVTTFNQPPLAPGEGEARRRASEARALQDQGRKGG